MAASWDTSALPKVHPTVVHMLADAAERADGAEALVCGDRRLSYTAYLRCVAGFARELVALGARGSRVALVCGNSIDMPLAMFAVHAAGAQAVPINPAYTARERCPSFKVRCLYCGYPAIFVCRSVRRPRSTLK